MKSVVFVMFFAFLCLGAAPDVAVYPGAVVDEQLGKIIHQSNAEITVYTTPDAFEKVETFYKKNGGEDVPHSRNMSADYKLVVLRFPGKKFVVQLSWAAADKKHGTVLQLLPKPE